MRRFGGTDDLRRHLCWPPVRSRPARPDHRPGATWLDHRLVERSRMPLAMGGYGAEVREALDARAEHLADAGLAQRQGQRIILQRNLLATLRRRELDAVGQTLEAETGQSHRPAKSGEHVSAPTHASCACPPGRYAMIEGNWPRRRTQFPARPLGARDRHRLGQHITGIARSGGGIDWSLGRKRGLGL